MQKNFSQRDVERAVCGAKDGGLPLDDLAKGRDNEFAADFLGGVDSIVSFLGAPWTVRKVRYARETGALPIRMKRGIGLYAFKSELLAAMKEPDSLPVTLEGQA